MNIVKNIPTVLILGLSLLMGACTQTGDHTTTAAAAGGAVGAGLGAIVGNQVGNTGEGLVIGGIAGAGTGAAIGSVLDDQQTAIKTQDEALERQEKVIMAQKNELNELRKMGQDQVSFDSGNNQYGQQYANSPVAPAMAPMAPGARQPFTNTSNVREATIATDSSNSINRPLQVRAQERELDTGVADRLQQANNQAQVRGSYGWDREENQNSLGTSESDFTAQQRLQQMNNGNAAAETIIVNGGQPYRGASNQVVNGQGAGSATARAATSVTLNTAECAQANTEAQAALSASEAADKLFHYRRALRLCPDNPNFHNGLGEVYVSLNRKEDAKYEFNEALRLNPSHSGAMSNLSTVQ